MATQCPNLQQIGGQGPNIREVEALSELHNITALDVSNAMQQSPEAYLAIAEANPHLTALRLQSHELSAELGRLCKNLRVFLMNSNSDARSLPDLIAFIDALGGSGDGTTGGDPPLQVLSVKFSTPTSFLLHLKRFAGLTLLELSGLGAETDYPCDESVESYYRESLSVCRSNFLEFADSPCAKNLQTLLFYYAVMPEFGLKVWEDAVRMMGSLTCLGFVDCLTELNTELHDMWPRLVNGPDDVFNDLSLRDFGFLIG